ncbi:MAG: ABC transporter permease [Alphaproteobacteria bacterium]|nr:ABC transporter permease [Alphaproteobacteria bacterium]MBU1281463.1 ABC transporter permease [Alphaproteobacteria bacterium]MBU1571710.1 ABC transporter permease [Alphaproteobacteria bacterium]MBU1830684.1 ABC transporter permease [Alphaproteobacteria bacterium]MBU2078561.1 ABC transporter permease [Alphaproteobacteria bacterium]
MTIPPRWRKLIADFGSIKGRLALVIAAMAIGLLTTIAITNAYAILTREISANYLGTNPASGILDIGEVDQTLVAQVRGMDNVAAAEPLSIVETRVRYPDGRTGRALLFVSPNPLDQSLNTLRVEEQMASPPANAVHLERRALDLADIGLGERLSIEIPGSGFVPVLVAGTVFDPSLAPAEQEQTIYAYLSQQTFIALGGQSALEWIKVLVADDPFDQTLVDQTLAGIAIALEAEGHNVHLVQAPNAGLHPHEGQMRGILGLFLAFGVLAFLLSAVLVSITVEGLMAQQIRQIAIMKTIGARTAQISTLYITGIAIIAAAMLFVALPIGIALGRGLAGIIADLLNFDIVDASTPPALFAAWLVTGLLIPVLFALRPIFRATGTTVVAALSDLGIGRSSGAGGRLNRFVARLFGTSGQTLLALRGAFRRRRRTMMILTLLGLAGAMYMTAGTVSVSYQASVDIAAAERGYDAEFRLTRPLDRNRVAAIAAATPDVIFAAPMMRLEAARMRGDGVALVRTYPDGGHGSMTLYALPGAQELARFQGLEGALPVERLDGQMVVNQGAWALLGRPRIGEQVNLSLDGKRLELPLAAVIRQYMTPASVFAADTDVAAMTGESGINALRVVNAARSPAEVEAVVDRVGQQIEAAGAGISLVVTGNLMDAAVSGHVNILIVLLLALGVLMAAVGFLGLTAAQGISVLERTREFGIIRAIGGQRRQIVTNLLTESLVIASISLPAAILVSIPLSTAINIIVGRMTFGMALPFTPDVCGMGEWAAVSLVGALVAGLPPAFNASRLSVRETLVQQ